MNRASNGIIWAVGRPDAVRLYAFDANSGAQLTERKAGIWVTLKAMERRQPCPGGCRWQSLCRQLQTTADLRAPAARLTQVGIAAAPSDESSAHITYGTVAVVQDKRITLETRTGKFVTIDASHPARAHAQVTPGVAPLEGDVRRTPQRHRHLAYRG
jgi:hypothetical protein